MELLGIISVDFNVTDQQQSRFSAFIRYWRKNGSTMRQCISYSYTSKKAYVSVRREVLYNILIEFGIPMKLDRLIKMCLNKTYCKDHMGKYLFDSFPIQNGLRHRDTLSPLLFNFALDMPLGRSRKIRWD
jgi:hypothetical protein